MDGCSACVCVRISSSLQRCAFVCYNTLHGAALCYISAFIHTITAHIQLRYISTVYDVHPLHIIDMYIYIRFGTSSACSGMRRRAQHG